MDVTDVGIHPVDGEWPEKRGHASNHSWSNPVRQISVKPPPSPCCLLFEAELWLWDARRTDAWTFVSLPGGESEEIRDLVGGLRHGFGSLRVLATVGSSTWTTSIFPGRAGYVLPVKRSIRVAEALDVRDMAAVMVELMDFA